MPGNTDFILSQEVEAIIAREYNVDPAEIAVCCIYSKGKNSLWKLYNRSRIEEITGLDKVKVIWKFESPYVCNR